jgi:hypothetical protein
LFVQEEVQGFDKLSPNGAAFRARARCRAVNPSFTDAG